MESVGPCGFGSAQVALPLASTSSQGKDDATARTVGCGSSWLGVSGADIRDTARSVVTAWKVLDSRSSSSM
jgi:hypothetical protein